VDDRERGRRFRIAISRGPILLDSAIGTRLIARGLDLRTDDPALWNLSRPEEISRCHNLDIAAGSDAIYTNTFGAHRGRLAQIGAESLVRTANVRAVELARAAVGPSGFVIGCVGPREVMGESPATISANDSYREQAEVLIDSGVDALVLETHRVSSAEQAIPQVRSLSELPILVSLVQGPKTSSDAQRLADLGAFALGLNCETDLKAIEDQIIALARADLPLLVKPGGSSPSTGAINSPEDFADAVPRLLRYGVRLFGGCCGSTEAHLAALRTALGRSAHAP
jgi:5-methyltetrahydrofolate--homocysteine methyltransferase